jgi:general secretion pathway protein G
MYCFVEKIRRERERKGFTLVELLVVIVVLAVLAAIVLPKFMDSSKRSKESALKSDLKLLRNGVSLFQADCGCFPKTLDDLKATSAPAKGVDSSGNEVDITATDWHGPYLQEIPKDPVSAAPFNYSTASGSVGQVTSSATGNALDGTAYSTW